MDMRKIRVGIFGLGTVGSAYLQLLRARRQAFCQRLGVELVPVAVVVSRPGLSRKADVSGIEISDDPALILDNPDIDIVVELMGGVDLARTVILRAFAAGKGVVTANKALLAEHGNEIFTKAREAGMGLGFEASVCAGIPVIRALKSSLCGDSVWKVSGIVNGTSNYILDSMTEAQMSFDEALHAAQTKGYAEADPSFDVQGFDAMHKLVILTRLTYGGWIPVKEVYQEGITGITLQDINFADRLGFVIRHLAVTRRRGEAIEMRVHPVLLEKQHPLANVRGVNNAILIKGEYSGPLFFQGQGAGGDSTAAAVMGDTIDLTHMLIDQHLAPHNTGWRETLQLFVSPIENLESRHYLSIKVKDQPGVLGKVSTILGKNGVSISAVVQPESALGKTGKFTHIVLLTHKVSEQKIKTSLGEIENLDFLLDKVSRIRIEEMPGNQP